MRTETTQWSDQPASEQSHNGRLQLAVALAMILSLLVAFTVWAGLPPEGERLPFIGGIVILALMTAGFAALGWHLFIRPLPEGQIVPREQGMSAFTRQILAVLIVIAGINFVIGAFWDEVWHRQYGVPFGEDFFWRPHLMMYFCFLLITVFAFASLYHITQRGRGTFQQRFRANPLVGLLVLGCGFILYAVAADPIWHLIYGEDISAWSIPHIMLVLSFVVMMLLSLSLHLSTLPPRQWRGLLPATSSDILPVVALGFVPMLALQLLTAEWEQPQVLPIVEARPDWLLGANITAIGCFVGALVNHSMRRWGMAAAAVGLAFALRFILTSTLPHPEVTIRAFVLLAAVMLTFDALYTLSGLRTGKPPHWLLAGAGTGLIAAVIVLPTINALYVYPTIDAGNLLPMVLSMVVAGVGGVWTGRVLGDEIAARVYDRSLKAEDVAVRRADGRRVGVITLMALVPMALFIAFFIATAEPPI
ncbi:MAG: hypothetical protein EA396_05660 [Anaerolineaceae bacterium]|nr:MAG: hypothetical protein EA396_05660 [Anaerolineaceae bacterium]